MAWSNIVEKGTKELGEPYKTASPEYKEWRIAREVPSYTPMKDLPNEEISKEKGQNLTSMVHQMEALKAQVRHLETLRDADEVKIIVLKEMCDKKDKKIAELNADCEFAYADPKRLKRNRGMSFRVSEIKEFKDQIAIRDGEIMDLLREKQKLESDMEVQKEHMEYLQRDLSEALIHADEGWSRSRDYYDSMIMANQEVEQLRKQVGELALEKVHWMHEAYNSQVEKEGLVEGWRLVHGVIHHDLKRYMNKYVVLSGNVQCHTRQWVGMFDEADAEIRANRLKVPPKVNRFLKYSRDLARTLRGMRIREIM
jgi:hypothetical protein